MLPSYRQPLWSTFSAVRGLHQWRTAIAHLLGGHSHWPHPAQAAPADSQDHSNTLVKILIGGVFPCTLLSIQYQCDSSGKKKERKQVLHSSVSVTHRRWQTCSPSCSDVHIKKKIEKQFCWFLNTKSKFKSPDTRTDAAPWPPREAVSLSTPCAHYRWSEAFVSEQHQNCCQV